jgi:hypothetical protein
VRDKARKIVSRKEKKPAEAGQVGNALLRLSNRCVKGYSDGERMQVALCQVGGRETRRESVPYTQVFRERGKKVFVLLQHPLDESAAFCRIVQVVAQWKRAVFFAAFTKNLRVWNALPARFTSADLAQCDLHPFAVGIAFYATVRQSE